MDTQRLILFFVFATALFLLWDGWQKEHRPPQQTVARAPASAPAGSGTATPSALPQTQNRTSDVPAAGPAESGAGERVTIRTDMLQAVINTRGGVIEEIDLLKHKSVSDKEKPYVLLQDTRDRIFVAESGLLGPGLPNHKNLYILQDGPREMAAGQETLPVVLKATTPQGVEVTQTLTFHRGSYLIDVTYDVANKGSVPIAADAYYQIVRDNKPPEGQHSMVPAYTGPALYDEENKFTKVAYSDIDKGKTSYAKTADNGWIAMLEHYFVVAWLPSDANKLQREFFTKRLPDAQGRTEVYAAGLVVPAGSIAPGQSARVDVPLYAGPQEQEKLAQIAKGLDLTVDYGIFTVIAAPLFWLLRWLHKLVGNWGWAIVLLTVLIKAAFYPLNAASARSMAKMKLVAPKMKAIQEQYANDKQRQQQAMMELYRTEKINPLGGCLPILVQMPVFLALYWVLLEAVELRHAPWLGWIHDLSAPDPWYVLPVIYAITAYLQVKLNPTPAGDPAQQKMMQIMPIAFSVMFIFFPAGLVLYWLVNNVISIAQQWRVNTVLAREAAVHHR
jgi:YidC/Oxa1 family membrane protein insertase